MKSFKKSTLAIATTSFAALATLIGSAEAAVTNISGTPINFSFVNSPAGAASNTDGIVFTDDPGTWSVIGTSTPGTSNPGGLSVTITGSTQAFGATDTDVRGGGYFWNSVVNQWSISGLTPNGVYDIVFLGQANAVNQSLWTITTGSGTVVSDAEADGNIIGAVADGTGTLGGDWQSAISPTNNFSWAGIQISAVPEPASLALLGVGMVAICGGRSRKHL